MKPRSKPHSELFWPRVVVRKWLNITTKDSDYSADTDTDAASGSDSSSDDEEFDQCGRKSRFKDNRGEPVQADSIDAFPRIRRRKSETFRAQYINTKEIRICVGTWNVGGKLPPDDLDIDDWIDTNDPADIYVLGLQEIVPLNAGNIFGAEDSRPVPKWENIIREALNRVRPCRTRVKCYSDPSSPSKFKPSDDLPDIEEELLFGSDSDIGEEIHPLDEESHDLDEVEERTVTSNTFKNHGIPDSADGGKLGMQVEQDLQGQFSSPKKFDRLNCLRTADSAQDVEEMQVEQDLQRQFSSPKRFDRLNCLRTEDSAQDVEEPIFQHGGKLTRMLSGSERIGLSWPEPPLNLLPRHVLQRPSSFKSIKSLKAANSFKTYSSFKSFTNEMQSGLALLAEIDLEALMKRKRKPSYVRIVSKQMVGIFLTIWVRRSLRKHIQNLKVSTVGVGVMGYIGNKGSISVSMSIYQTLFCFICTHLTSGEKDGDELKRNADVHEIHRRTQFRSISGVGLPKSIYDHERVIWLGDLNYRINLSYEKTCELIAKKEWSKLMERDQLVREQRKGRAFDGWSEGSLTFPPTYKYEMYSNKYYGEDPKAGRRNPAWCDRILSYGKEIRLLNYRRAELRLSDHRPVTATYMVEVEVFCPRKLQRALTYTDAEIENEEVMGNMSIDIGMSQLRLEQDFCCLEPLRETN